MVLFNYATKELTAKVVYYGPGLCGKTTNLQFIFDSLPSHAKGKMLSLATKTDRTLFFDFLPIDLGTIRGMKTKIQLYTVPGQVFYDTTRKLVLKGADGVVFVADSQDVMAEANIDSFDNLVGNLKEQRLDIKDMPHVIQFNKRDMKSVLPVGKLNEMLNRFNVPTFEAIATQGDGVFETLKGISKLVLKNLSKKYGLEEEKEEASSSRNSSKLSTPKPKVPDLPPKPQAVPQTAPTATVRQPTPEPKTVHKPAAEKVPVKPRPELDEIEFIEDDSINVDSVEDLKRRPEVPFEAEPEKESANRPAAAVKAPGAEKKSNLDNTLEPISTIDDSEVIELDDVDPLEVEELDDMAEIASMASSSKVGVATEEVSQSKVAPIEVPITINLPGSLEGKPLRLQIDIIFNDE